MARPLELTDREAEQITPRRRSASTKRKIFTLPIEQIRPVVRIAHRPSNPIQIPNRTIIDHEIVLLLRGRVTCVIDGTPHRLRASEMILLPPFVEHRFLDSTPESEHIAVHFDLSPDVPGTRAGARSAAYGVQLTHGQSLPTCRTTPAGSRLVDMLERLVLAFAENTPWADVECSNLLGALLSRLIGRAVDAQTTPPAHDWRLRRLLQHIDQHLSDPLDAETLAKVADLSPSRLRSVFGTLMGLSPKQYIRQRRIAMARILLAQPDKTIKEVARLTGFADEFHFSKAFRQIDGLPPSQFRQQALASRF